MAKILTPAGIRWTPEIGFEIICPSCARKGTSQYYWPLTEEFWNWKQTLTKCRACISEEARIKASKRYRTSESYRERTRKYLEEYRKDNSDIMRLKNAEYRKRIKEDPERHEQVKARQREATARWRQKKKEQRKMLDMAIVQLKEAIEAA